MVLTSRAGVAIAEIVFYVPALALAIVVAVRHGFKRQAGWIFLIILALIRIVGGCIELVSEQQTNPSIGLFITSAILAGVGLSPLLLAMLGILQRLHEGLNNGRAIPTRFFRILQLALIAALALSIVGGLDGYDPTNPPDTIQTGHNLSKAAIIIFTVTFIGEVAITAFTATQINAFILSDTILFYAVAASVPFLLIRLLYSLLAIFDTNTTIFNLLTGSVAVQACMEQLMEFIVVILYLGAGLKAPSISVSRDPTDPSKSDRSVRMQFLPQNRREDGGRQFGHRDHSYDGQVSGTI